MCCNMSSLSLPLKECGHLEGQTRRTPLVPPRSMSLTFHHLRINPRSGVLAEVRLDCQFFLLILLFSPLFSLQFGAQSPCNTGRKLKRTHFGNGETCLSAFLMTKRSFYTANVIEIRIFYKEKA